jgi:CRP-like cAMP-binding protein
MNKNSLNQVPGCNNCKNHRKDVAGVCSLKDIHLDFSDKKLCVYQKGEYLFKEEEKSKGIFCLYSGKVRVSQSATDKEDGASYEINEGQLVNGIAHFSNGKHTNSAMALEETAACIIPLSQHLFALRLAAKKN